MLSDGALGVVDVAVCCGEPQLKDPGVAAAVRTDVPEPPLEEPPLEAPPLEAPPLDAPVDPADAAPVVESEVDVEDDPEESLPKHPAIIGAAARAARK